MVRPQRHFPTVQRSEVMDMKKKTRLKYSTKRKINGFIFVLPFLIGFLLCFAIPIFNTFYYSFQEVSVNKTGGMKFDFNGIKNYVSLFKDEVTTDSCRLCLDLMWWLICLPLPQEESGHRQAQDYFLKVILLLCYRDI